MWIIGSAAAVVGLIVVVAAFLLDRPVEADGDAPATALPAGLPRPGDVRSLRFPTAWWGGYDHRAVDAELRELAERYEALYVAAGPSVLAEAERRLAGGDLRPGPTTDGSSAEELEDGGGDGAGVLDR